LPEIYPITSNVFPGLLERLGVRLTAPRVPLYYLSDTVMPVSIVDSNITLDAVTVPGVEIFATEGTKTAPAAGVDLADTGQLVAGNFVCRVYCNFLDSLVNNILSIQHRNAADSANIWDYKFNGVAAVLNQFYFEFTEAFAANERLRVEVLVTATAAMTYNGIIWRRLLT